MFLVGACVGPDSELRTDGLCHTRYVTRGECDKTTRESYDAGIDRRTLDTTPQQVELVKKLRAEAEGIIVDLGCGSGRTLTLLEPAVGIDLPLELGHLTDDHGAVIQADLHRLPFARESIGGVWASRILLHLPRTEVPMALAELHRVMQTGATGYLWAFEGDDEAWQPDDTPFPRGAFSLWPQALLRQTLEGAGFEAGEFITWESEVGIGQIIAPITKRWTLPDYVGADMKLLICGLNPSPSSADFGVGFHKAGNRFWPAAIQSGLVTKDRDPVHALAAHGMGMTDMVKRSTRRADELDKAEYRAGYERLARLAEWLRPQTICMVGLAGWRAAVNRKAQRGWQPEAVGGRPVYVMPSSSGLNAHDTVDTLAEHMRSAALGR